MSDFVLFVFFVAKRDRVTGDSDVAEEAQR
jgi:hypothetical protein